MVVSRSFSSFTRLFSFTVFPFTTFTIFTFLTFTSFAITAQKSITIVIFMMRPLTASYFAFAYALAFVALVSAILLRLASGYHRLVNHHFQMSHLLLFISSSYFTSIIKLPSALTSYFILLFIFIC